MPELPEVETIARQLDLVLEGKKISGLKVLRQVSFSGKEKDVIGQTIAKVDRHAKMVVVHLARSNWVLMIHLKMTGQLIWRPKGSDGNPEDGQYNGKQVVGGHPSSDWVMDLPSNHTRVIFSFSDGSQLFFNDMRVFGWVRTVTLTDLEKMLAKLPPDVVDPLFSLDYFQKVISGSRRAIKMVLLDGTKIGGVGNIYANDALWLAKIDPKKPSNQLTGTEVESLYRATKKVIKLGIKYGGATSSDYVDVKGLGGKYQEYFLTYKQEGKPCQRCNHKILKFFLGGRGTYWCPNCQKDDKQAQLIQ